MWLVIWGKICSKPATFISDRKYLGMPGATAYQIYMFWLLSIQNSRYFFSTSNKGNFTSIEKSTTSLVSNLNSPTAKPRKWSKGSTKINYTMTIYFRSQLNHFHKFSKIKSLTLFNFSNYFLFCCGSLTKMEGTVCLFFSWFSFQRIRLQLKESKH